MLALEIIAERKIEEAVAHGELQGLPGEGRPLDLWEDPLVPEELRMARRILRNADLEPVDILRELGRPTARSALQLASSPRRSGADRPGIKARRR